MNGEGGPSKPHRAYELTIRIGADTWEDALAQVDHFAQELHEHGSECGLTTGGYSTGGYISIVHDPNMTHDRWYESLRAYLDAQKVPA